MANELNAILDPSQTGLTVVAKLRVPGGAQQGSDISTSESGSRPGWYTGTMPATPLGVYAVDFVSGSDVVANGMIAWDGSQEVDLLDLSTLDEAGVQSALTAQGYTAARAVKLDFLDAAISSVLSAISALNNISIAGVQSAMTAQGYTTTRAAFLDNLVTILTSVEKIRKVSSNKVVVSLDELTVDVYEDNGSTIAFSFSISADKLTRTPI